MPKDIPHKWFIADVGGITLGKAAVKIANLLRGKNKASFTPQYDFGDHVVVINAKSIALSAKKMEGKMYYWHTKYPGGLRQKSAQQLMAYKPEKILADAVSGMLPKNKLRMKMMKKLHIFADANHTHEAQKPEKYTL